MTSKIYKNVHIGENATIGDFVIIGIPPNGTVDGELSTTIANGANIRSHTVIYAGNVIGENFQTGHGALIRENNTIGNNVSIGSNSVVEFSVTIEDDVRIHSQAFLPEYCHIKKNAWIGPNVVLTNAKYPKSNNVKADLSGVTVEERVKIGANSTILPGINLGQRSLIGAGSVVTKDVAEDHVVAGNPAKKIKVLSQLPYESL